MKKFGYLLIVAALIVFLIECGPEAFLLLPLGIIIVLILLVSGCKFK